MIPLSSSSMLPTPGRNTSLRLRHQYQQIQEGREPDNFIDPQELGTLERTMLKGSFKLIMKVQEAAMKKYNPWMVM